MCSIEMQSVTLKSLLVNVEAIQVSLGDKSVPEDAVGRIEVENSKLLAAFNNSKHPVI